MLCNFDIELIKNAVIQFIIIKGSINLSSTFTLFLKISGFLAALKVVFPKDPVKIKTGRPIQIIDLEKLEEEKIWCESEFFTLLRLEFERNTNNPLLAYRYAVSYYDDSENLINKEFYDKKISVVAKDRWGKDTEEEWEKALAQISHDMNCLEEKHKVHLTELKHSFGNISDIFNFLRNKYGYEINKALFDSDKSSHMTFEDPDLTNKTLCKKIKQYSSCAKENTELLTRLKTHRKILNIVKISNSVGDNINNVDIHIDASVEIVSDGEIEGFEVFGKGFYKRISLGNLLPNENKYVFLKTHGHPIKEDSISVTSPWYTKVDTKSAKNILTTSVLITLLITTLTYIYA